jgi:hypothetical protein
MSNTEFWTIKYRAYLSIFDIHEFIYLSALSAGILTMPASKT